MEYLKLIIFNTKVYMKYLFSKNTGRIWDNIVLQNVIGLQLNASCQCKLLHGENYFYYEPDCLQQII